MGLDSLTSAFGLLVSFRGVSAVLGPPLAGAVLQAVSEEEDEGQAKGEDFAVVFGVAAALFAAGAVSGQVFMEGCSCY